MYMQRIKIFLSVIAVGLLVVIARLGQIQIIQGGDYLRKASRMMHVIEPLPAPRGRILDRKATGVLAADESCWDFCLDYWFLVLAVGEPDDRTVIGPDIRRKALRWQRRQIRRIAQRPGMDEAEARAEYQERFRETLAMANQAAEALGLDLLERMRHIVRRIERMRRDRNIRPREEQWMHPVVHGLGQRHKVELEARLHETVGAVVRASHKRHYPYHNTACHVIGRVGQVDADEQQRLNLPRSQADWPVRIRANYLGGDMIGKRGIERMFENVLRGQRGYRRVNKRTGEVLEEVPAVPGADVRLTLDVDLQMDVTELFLKAGHTGAAVVLSVPTGRVLALVSVPTFDLNTFRRSYSALIAQKIGLPLRHRAVTQLYHPGSAIKPLIALGALSRGVISVDRTATCYKCMFPEYPDKWRCLGRHGDIAVSDAIKRSCNVYFYHVGQMMRVAGVRQWLGQIGFTELPGTGLPDELPGIVPRAGTPGIARQMAIGQIFTASPLHVANAVAAIARGGESLSPKLVLDPGPKQVRRKLPVSPEAVRIVQQAMYRVVNEPGGTGYKVFRRGAPLGVTVCGKTGTAQTPAQRVDIDGDGATEPVREGNMAWFVGYAPHDHPKIAFAVVVEYVEGHGSTFAGPIARELVRASQYRGCLR